MKFCIALAIYLFTLSIAIVTILAKSYASPEYSNLLPMYGDVSPSINQVVSDNEAVTEALKLASGSKQKATEETIKLAWKYFYEYDDASTAMKRFNQAWLIDSSSCEAFYGFGFLMARSGKIDQAITFFKKALEINPSDGMSATRLAVCYKDKALEQYEKTGSANSAEVKAYLTKSLELFDHASRTSNFYCGLRGTTLNEDLAYVFYHWAAVLEFDGQYAKAWDKVHLALNAGGNEAVEPGFIQELTHFMPDPQNKKQHMHPYTKN